MKRIIFKYLNLGFIKGIAKSILLFNVFIFVGLFADTLTIIAVGDIMMGTTYPDIRLPANNGKDIFKEVTPVLSAADLTFGNLEGPLLEGGDCTKKIEKGRCYAFRTPPSYVQHLVDAGFDFLSLKNNHANDFGPKGLTATTKALTEASIKYGTDDKGGEFLIKNKKIYVISFSTSSWGNSIFEIEKAQRIVAELSRPNDIVIVSFHGGGEGVKHLHTKDTFEYYLGWPRGNVVKFAHAVIDSGADLVWGHGPHVPRSIEIYNNRLIAYSLGNFFTWGFNLDDERGYAPILKVVLDSMGGFLHGEIISAIQKTLQYPKLDSLHRAAKLIKKLSLDDFPHSTPEITETGKILPPNRTTIDEN